jgi:hypothetical protein
MRAQITHIGLEELDVTLVQGRLLLLLLWLVCHGVFGIPNGVPRYPG